jgi:isochorismate synthase
MMTHVDESIGLARLTRLCETAHEAARRHGRPILASLTDDAPEIDPLAFYAATASYDDRALWFQLSADFALAAAGAVQTIAGDGPGRFDDVRGAWRALLADAQIEGAGGPCLLGGFAFDPERPSEGQWHGFGDARFVLPRITLSRDASGCRITLNALLWPESDPLAESRVLADELDRLAGQLTAGRAPVQSPDEIETAEVIPAAEWQAIVAGASAAIRGGDLRKVVLAREIRLRSERAFDVDAVLERLVRAYPTCSVFAISQGRRTFLGATPERLVRFAGGELRTACLAGSERRGATVEEDRQLGEGLLLSPKNREEHAVVVRVLRESLSGLCDELIRPDAPELLRVSNVHHLYTPVTARPRAGVGLLDAVERLHPTPAVGGDPRQAALAYIRAQERLDRGWYAAPVGWLGHDGAGEFAVALRSALVDGTQASLFAGCGIMGDSDPAREYTESWLKFRPMLAALGGAAR